MPVTFWTVTIASMALVGLFPLAGFWSKDEILGDAWEDRQWVFWLALTGVFLTALYVGRMLFMTFGGEYRGGEPIEHGGVSPTGDGEEHSPTAHHGPSEPHESPPLMLIPLVVLAVMAVVAGFANIDHDMETLLAGWLPEHTHELVTESDFSWWIAIGSTLVGVAGLGVAWAIYGARLLSSDRIRSALQPFPQLLENKYYLDYLYEEIFVKEGLMRSIALVVDLWDRYVIDGLVNGVARAARWTSDQARQTQAGQAQLYGAAMFIGVVGAIAGILVVNPP
jgi:NADH-quinone oxidoreductase subunit L